MQKTSPLLYMKIKVKYDISKKNKKNNINKMQVEIAKIYSIDKNRRWL